MKKTAPLSAVMPLVAVQESQSMPMEEMGPATPSVTLMVSHESYAAVGSASTKAAGTPPMSRPNGAATWNAGGSESTLDERPKMEYSDRASPLRSAERMYVAHPSADWVAVTTGVTWPLPMGAVGAGGAGGGGAVSPETMKETRSW